MKRIYEPFSSYFVILLFHLSVRLPFMELFEQHKMQISCAMIMHANS